MWLWLKLFDLRVSYIMKTYSDVYKQRKLNVWLDISTYCNAACPQCHRTNPETLNKVDWLPLVQWSLEQFKMAFPVKTLKHIKNVQICGTWGDPGMNKDLLEICKYIIDNSNAFIFINTNGSMRDEFWWTHLGYIIKDRGRTIFCVDGIDQEMHSHYRQKTDLDTVLENMKGYGKWGRVGVFTVIYKHNEDYLKQINEMVKDVVVVEEHLCVPSDRAHHIDVFKFYKDGELNTLEHSPKYGKNKQGAAFTL